MHNPKTFQATPFSHSAPTDHSGGGKSQGKKFRGERPSKVSPTSYEHDAKVQTNLPNLKGAGKMEMASPSYGPGAPMIHQPKSGEQVWTKPKKAVHKSWKNKGKYDMTAPTMESPSSESFNGGSSLS
jgi:hypothetical protein